MAGQTVREFYASKSSDPDWVNRQTAQAEALRRTWRREQDGRLEQGLPGLRERARGRADQARKQRQWRRRRNRARLAATRPTDQHGECTESTGSSAQTTRPTNKHFRLAPKQAFVGLCGQDVGIARLKGGSMQCSAWYNEASPNLVVTHPELLTWHLLGASTMPIPEDTTSTPKSGVYCITCTANGKVYVGSAVSFTGRERLHKLECHSRQASLSPSPECLKPHRARRVREAHSGIRVTRWLNHSKQINPF